MGKLTSRKFWLAVGGSAAGIGTLIAGITIPNETATLALSILGICLTAVSIVAYNFAEAYVDGKAVDTVNIDLVTEDVAEAAKLILSTDDYTKIGGSE